MYEPLKGTLVLDCTRLLPYAYCTMILADLGAEVIKIEEPKEGDYGRWGDAERTYESALFVMTNRNKKSMRLDLKQAKGKEIFLSLVAKGDVIIESFRPGVMDRLKLGYTAIKKSKPDIIYCSCTGYGQEGPYRHKAGHDVNYLALSGILGLTGEHTGRPVLPGIPIGDMAGGGIFPALAIIAALLGREKSGSGQFIDVAQLDVLTSLNVLNLAEAIAHEKGEKSRPHNLRGKTLCYNTFETKDKKFVALGALEGKFWKNFCDAINRPDLIGWHLTEYMEGNEQTENLKNLFMSKTSDEWEMLFKDKDICFSRVLSPSETMEDVHLLQRKMIWTMDDPKRGLTRQIGFPGRFADELAIARRPAPFFGEHTDAILRSLGHSPETISKLKEEGIIG